MVKKDCNVRCILRYDDIKATGRLNILAGILVTIHVSRVNM